jgi:hypothetical protein
MENYIILITSNTTGKDNEWNTQYHKLPFSCIEEAYKEAERLCKELNNTSNYERLIVDCFVTSEKALEHTFKCNKFGEYYYTVILPATLRHMNRLKPI